MSEYLLAYGTLQPDRAPDEIASVVAQLRPVGQGSIRGELYDFGDYPGAVPDPSSMTKISGTVFRLPQDEAVLRRIDEYEGFELHTPEKSLFIRQLHPVELATGETLQCWIYVYNQKPNGR